MTRVDRTASTNLRYSTHPLLWLSIAFSLGVWTVSFLAPGWWPALILSVGTALIAYSFPKNRFAGTFLLLSFFFAGSACYQLEVSNVRSDRIRVIYDSGQFTSGSPVEIEGSVSTGPEPAIDGVFVGLSVSKIRGAGDEHSASGIVRLFIPLVDEDQISDLKLLGLRPGMRIRVACELIREDEFLNPGVLPKRQLLDQQGIDATATVKSPLLFEPLGQNKYSSIIDPIYGLRGRLIDEFRERFSPSTSGVMIASLLGDKYFLNRDTARVFRDGGTFHVLVISGLHITFIGGLLLWFVSCFTSERRIHLVLVGSSLWAYSLAVGGEVPVVRACVMFTVFLVSRVIYRSGNLLNTLGLSCLILMIWRPSDLFSPSYQLTVVAVASIVAMAFPIIEKLRAIGSWMPDAARPFPPNVPHWTKRFCEMLYWQDDVWKIDQERQIWSGRIFKRPFLAARMNGFAKTLTAYVFEGLLISVIVQIWMLPLMIYYFHRVTPVAIFLNLWVGIFIALESFAALLAIVFGVISSALSFPFTMIAEALNWLLVSIPKVVIYPDWSSFRVPIYSGEMKSIYLIYLLPVIVTAYFLYKWDPFDLLKSNDNYGRKFRRTVASASVVLILAALMVFHPLSAPYPDGKLHVEFLDVGQGDSAFVTFPDGRTMLIDGGGSVAYRNDDDGGEQIEPDVPRIGEKVVSEFLWEKGYSKVDYLVASHADADHSQGLTDVVNNFDVETVYIGAWPGGGSELDELFTAAARRSVPIKQIGRGDRFEIGNVTMETLWPIKGKERSGSDNNSSIVMRLIYKDRGFLFTGDIEKEAEESLTAGKTQLEADVVKVPHHGSQTSSSDSFISSTKATWAVIPVGRRSRFGHPHPEVIGRWKHAGAHVITTGERGAVSFSTDGVGLETTTYVP